MIGACSSTPTDSRQHHDAVVDDEISQQGKLLLEDFDQRVADGRWRTGALYYIVYTKDEDGKIHYYALNEFRTRSGIRPLGPGISQDYYGPFSTLREFLVLHAQRETLFIVPAFGSWLEGEQIDGLDVLVLDEDEYNSYSEMSDQFWDDFPGW